MCNSKSHTLVCYTHLPLKTLALSVCFHCLLQSAYTWLKLWLCHMTEQNSGTSAVAQGYNFGLSNKRTLVWILCCLIKLWASYFTPQCSSSISCMNEYLAIDSGRYLCMNSLRALFATRLDVFQRSRDSVRLKVCQGVKCKALWAILMIGYCAI